MLIHHHSSALSCKLCFFFFNDTATTEIYTLSLHDALPISGVLGVEDAVGFLRLIEAPLVREDGVDVDAAVGDEARALGLDRKSTRLNSSHANISYAVFCLKKKKKHNR